jgi:Mce-associated membrane protein
MPPPRRRRPVQPATRVRLPRTARPRSTPGAAGPAEATASETRAAEQAGSLGAGAEAPEAPEDDLAEDDPAADDLAGQDDLVDDDVAEDDGLGGESSLAWDHLAEDGDGTAAGDSDTAAGEAGGKAADGRRGLVLPACLGAVAVVLGGLAVWFGLEAGSASSGVDTANAALTTPAATSQVLQQVTSAVNTIFSYNYADTAKTSQAAQSLLTGNAISQYNTLFKLVRQNAPQEKLVLTTTVTNAGVETLIGNQARLLVFVNQQETAGASHQTTDAGSMFAVSAVSQGGRWKITNINTFANGG